MATRDMKARLLLEAQTSGKEGIRELADELEALSKEGGEAAPKFDELAQSLRELGEQDAALDNFTQLRREVAETAEAMDAAAANVDRLDAELAQAAQAARAAAEAQDEASRRLVAARERQAEMKDAVAASRAELRQMREEQRQAGDASADYADKISEGAAQLKVMQGEQRAAAEETKVLAAASKQAADESRATAAAQKEAATAYEGALKNAGQLSSTLGEQNQALAQARQALDATGLSTQGLSHQQAGLRASIAQAERQASDYAGVVRQMRSETNSLGPALEATFKKLGMRGVAKITAEIEELQAAMRGLKGQQLLPEDAARLTTELQRRIAALRGEIKGVPDDARQAAAGIDQLGNASDRAGAQLGNVAKKALAFTGAMVGLGELKQVASKVLETGSAFEQLERRLTGILGGSEKAAQAMAMLRQLAQDTPFDVQGLTDSYAKLSAFGLQPTREQMLAIIDTSAKLGGGTEALTGVTLALGQAWTKQKLQGEEILQLAERGVPVWDLLAKATGKNVLELQKMSEAGQLGRDVILKLLDAMGSASAGASADLMASYAGAVQRAQDALQEFFNMIAQSGVLEYLRDQLQEVLAQFDRMKESGQLKEWAKGLSDGFITVAKTTQGLISVLRDLAPVISVAAKLFVGMKLAEVAAGFAGIAAKGKEADSVLKQIGQSSFTAKVGLTAVTMAATFAADQLLRLAKAYGELKAAQANLTRAQRETDALQKKTAERFAEISRATGVVVRSFEELEAAVAAGTIVVDKASGTYLSAAQAQAQLAGAVKQTVAQMAQADATNLVAQFDKANAAAGETDKALKALAESLEFKNARGAGAFVLAMDEIRAKGVLTAKQVGDAWQDALGKLRTGQLGALRANLEEAARAGIISAKQLAQANDQILTASFDRLGANAAQALGRISDGAQEAINSVGLVADAAEAAGVKTTEAARAIEMAFAAAIPKADSLEAIAELEKSLTAMGAAGKIGAEGLARTKAALDSQRAAIEDQLPGIQSLGEALRQLGVKPQKELEALAKKSKEAFDFIKASGTATTREVNEAWKAMAEAAIAANKGVADATIQAQAAQYGFVIKTDEAGKSVVESMKKAEDATRAVGAAAKGAAEQMEGMGNAAWAAGGDLVAQARAHNAALGELKGTWMDATAAASRYSSEMAQLVFEANKNVDAMRREHAALVEQMEALERQQKQLQNQNGGAARSVEDLRLKLLEMNGTEEEIAKARHEREVAEVNRQRALAEIELKRAQLKKDDEEVARLAAELDLMGQQLALLDKVFAEEEKQRKARQRDEARTKSQGGGAPAGNHGGSDSGGSGGMSAGGNLYVTLNANGITDPVKLAKMIEPELKKRAQLAR